MSQERREKIKETAYGFAMGASIPGVIIIPGLIYFALKGDAEAVKAYGQVGSVAMGVWGIGGAGHGDFSMRHALAARRTRRAERNLRKAAAEIRSTL